MSSHTGRGGATEGRGLVLVFVDPRSEESESAFNSWFDGVHLDELLQVNGIVAATRYRRVPIDSAVSPIEQRYMTALEVEADAVERVAAALAEAAPRMNKSDAVAREPSPAVMWYEVQTPTRRRTRSLLADTEDPMSSQDAALLRELVDRARILEVAATMARSLDTGDWDLLLSVVGPELVVDFSSYARRERVSDLDTWLEGLRRVFPHLAATAHTMSNPIVLLHGDTASCSAHMQAKHVRPTERGEGWYDLGGYYDFDLVRRNGTWLIVRLVHTTTWEAGNPRIMQEAAAAGEGAD